MAYDDDDLERLEDILNDPLSQREWRDDDIPDTFYRDYIKKINRFDNPDEDY